VNTTTPMKHTEPYATNPLGTVLIHGTGTGMPVEEELFAHSSAVDDQSTGVGSDMSGRQRIAAADANQGVGARRGREREELSAGVAVKSAEH
jgi:hypothetical protein